MSNFNEYRFGGLNHRPASNKYLTMDRVSADEGKIVVKVADCHLLKTRYGYGLILDRHHVCWIKDWAVSVNWYGNEVLLDMKYFTPKEWGEFDEFDEDEEPLVWDHWLQIATAQSGMTDVRWAK